MVVGHRLGVGVCVLRWFVRWKCSWGYYDGVGEWDWFRERWWKEGRREWECTIPTSLTVPGGVAALTSSFDRPNAYFQPGISVLRQRSQWPELFSNPGYSGPLEAAVNR